MKTAISPLALTLLFLLLLTPTAIAQKARQGAGSRKPSPATKPEPTPAVAQPTATPKPKPPRPPSAPIGLVEVNGQTITTADLDPAIRQQIDNVEERIDTARRSILDLQINTMLLEVEAKRRRISSHQLYELEVAKRIPTPTPAQIKQFIDDNKEQFEGMNQATISSQVSALMHDEYESRLADAFVLRLRKTIPVVMGVDITTPNLSGEAVLATIGGTPIRASMLNERLKPIIYRMRMEVYTAERAQAEQMVDNILLLAEAGRRQVGPEEIVRKEISDKLRPPSEAEVAKFYADNKARISGDLDSVRNQLINYLQEEARQKLEKEMSAQLRKNAQVRWLITEPPQPVQAVSVDDDPSLGPIGAPVTIVEFTDFQCPSCAAMHPILEEILKSYGNKVRFVVRDFPLQQHEWAKKAAEAANAAKAQGKFFEYAALLFQRQKALDVPSLKKYATELGLNRARFDAELDKGIYESEIKKDLEDGEIYGVGSTPSIFINGVLLKVLSVEGLREAIDRAAAGKPPVSPQ
jgi:protein-disulfide isomerase